MIEDVHDYFRPPRPPLPCLYIESELEEIVQAFLSRVASEEKQGLAVNNGGVKIAGRRNLTVGADVRPLVRPHAKLKKVVHPMHSIVATEQK